MPTKEQQKEHSFLAFHWFDVLVNGLCLYYRSSDFVRATNGKHATVQLVPQKRKMTNSIKSAILLASRGS
jgi:hypothetical protein